MLRYILMQRRLWTWYNIHDLCFVSELHYCCIDVLHEDFISSSYPRLLLWTHGSLTSFSSSSLFLYIYLLHILLEQSPGGTVFFRLLLRSSLSRLAGVWIACSVHELQTALGQFSYIDLSCCCKNQPLGTDHQDHEWYNKSHEELLGSRLQLCVTDQDLTSKEMQDYQRSSS